MKLKNDKNKRGPLLDHLDELEALCKQTDPSLKDIFHIFGPDGHYILILFLILPFLQPVPLFGLSTPFGLLIAIVASLAYASKPPWLPQRWAERKLSSTSVLKIAEGSERIFEKLYFLLYPRWGFLFKGPFRTINLILLLINAILLALPLPIPFSNAFPAWMILFQAFAHLEEDGLFIIFSYIQTALTILYFVLLAQGVILGASYV